MRRRIRSTYAMAAVAVISVLGLTGCGGGADPLSTTSAASGGSGASLVVGSADFTESEIIAQIYLEALNSNGVKATPKLNIGTRETYIKALSAGEINLVPDYTGNLLSYLDPKATAKTEADINKALPTALTGKGLKMLTPAEATDNDTLTVTKAVAEKWQLTTVGDLVKHNAELVIGGPPEFKTREVGLPGLKSIYGVVPSNFVEISDGGGPATVKALVDGKITAANIFSTSPDIATNNLVVLKDDKNVFLANNVVPVLNEKVSDPKAEKVLNAISAKLTTAELAQLNTDVSGAKREEPAAAAKAWVEKQGLGKVS